MIVTIHQPNFMPWYPFFQKIEQSDIFVILTNCQYEKNGFQNRFFLNNQWNTLSVYKGLENINLKRYVDSKRDWNRIKKSLYKYNELLEPIDYMISDNLMQTNIDIINYFIKKLNIKTKIVFDYPTELKSTDRLVDLCENYGATTYLAGIGGKDYLDHSLFEKKGIQVMYQENMNKIHTLEYLYEISEF
jgi:hypothetical protein